MVLSPVADELLSSWISPARRILWRATYEHAQHCLPEAASLRAVDLQLTSKQAIRLARMFATDAKFVRGMTFANVPPISHRLIASKPIQFCPKCMRDVQDATAFRRTQFLGWWLTCSSCGSRLRDSGEQDAPSPFRHYWSSALHGKKLIEDVSDKTSSILGIADRYCAAPPDAPHTKDPKFGYLSGTLQGSRRHYPGV